MLDILKSLLEYKYSPASKTLTTFNLCFVMHKDVYLHINKKGWSYFPSGVHLYNFHIIPTLILGYVLVHIGLFFPFLSGQ